ncbi:MAG: homocysteine S-methyltransferase family protein, partial [Longimicrobiales bacterium]
MNNQSYLELLQRRPVVFDGAMGTSVQSLNPSADDFGGEAFLGCNDHLVISSPHLVREIHASFLEVGCDVLETDTFRANPFSLREYGLQEDVEALNRTAASLAREVAR